MTAPKPKSVALRYSQLGYSIFPCHSIKQGICTCGNPNCGSPGKHPRTTHGVKDASKDPKQIEVWWKEWPDANIAIATGAISGVVVLDTDKKNGGYESLEKLEEEFGPLPETPMVLTGGGGRHYYFAYSPITNKAGLRSGLDIRSDGGYVIAPYSAHASGQTYEWEGSSTLTAIPLAPFPPYLKELIEEISEDSVVDVESVLNGVEEGHRDEELFRYGCRLRAKNMDREEAEVLILEMANRCKPPFTEEEARAKMEQAWKYSPGIARTLIEDVAKPVVEGLERTVKVTWPTRQVYAQVTQLKEHTDGRITGLLLMGTTAPGVRAKIHQALFNFMASRSRQQLATLLTERANVTDWYVVLEELCAAIRIWIEEGEPIILLDPETIEPKKQRFILQPILLEKDPVILYGEGGSGKSYLAQMFAYLISLGKAGEALDLIPNSIPMSVLYLDWEASHEDLAERFKRIRDALELPSKKIMYRFCARPLAIDAERIREIIVKNDLQFIVVDSLGPACGGDLNSSQPAIEFYNALRSLHVSSLLIAHAAKNIRGKTTPYGSVYYSNLARSVWEVVPYQTIEKEELLVGLYHKKTNFGPRRPLGFRFTFCDDDLTTIECADARKVPDAQDRLSISSRIHTLLAGASPATIKEIAEDLNLKAPSVSSALYRMYADKEVIKIDRQHWALQCLEEAPF